MTVTIGSLFTGAGGLDMGVEAAFDAETIWRSDIKPAACKLIEHYWPGTNLGDITTIDWDAVQPVDIITGGFPCTDISLAGKQAGLIRYGDGKTRSGLWAEMCRAINTLRPSLVVAENVRALTSATADSDMEPCPWCLGDGPTSGVRALGGVLADLADIGYDAAWCGLRAADVGAPHGRFRIFILAWPSADTTDRTRHRQRSRPESRQRDPSTSDTQGIGRGEGRTESARIIGGSDAALGCDVTAADAHDDRHEWTRGSRDGRAGSADSGHAAANTLGRRRGGRSHQPIGVAVRGTPTAGSRAVDWGQYTAAIERWERIFGRPVPHPTVTGPKGGQALSPDLTDWMMGWPAGSTDIPGLTRAQRLSLGGDGVVPQQAMAALQWLLQQIPMQEAS